MRKRNNRGFTMAEMLIVVAIIGVLAGVSFIGVKSHQRSMAQLERDTIAKEIYFAAQNHLTMAESQGFLTDSISVNADHVVDADKGVYCVAADDSDFFCQSMLGLMLPFGSIDETVRAGGSYLILYQANPAIVLDVFYCSKTGEPREYNKTGGISSSDYSTLIGYKPSDFPSSGYVVGWYGGAATADAGIFLDTPSVEVKNAEKLTVTVTNPNEGNADALLQLRITGVSSSVEAVFMLDPDNSSFRVEHTGDGKYVVTLDDISLPATPTDKGWHFADLATDEDVLTVNGTFTPGEDIIVVAVAFSRSTLANIAYSNEVTTNSLFADVVDDTEVEPATKTAIISNIRHLENLDMPLSGLNVALTHAKQIEDLDWNGFVTELGSSVRICNSGFPQNGTKQGCYLPVILGSGITYDGNNHVISNIVVDNTSNSDVEIAGGGIFATMATGSCVQNLAINDISVNMSSGNAGALVGTLTQTSAPSVANVSNVVAYHTVADKTIASSGNVGGLIGEMAGGFGKVEKSAAALIVSSSDGDAGGLIGKSEGGTVTACYSGGQTTDGKYTGTVTGTVQDYNVTATAGTAGGLIGIAGSNDKHVDISNSYSTCSTTGKIAGGFVGTAYGNMSNCYATGLVRGTDTEMVGNKTIQKDGAFAYSLTGTPTKCAYFEIINERADTINGGYKYLTALGKGEEKTGILAFDSSAEEYDKFVGPLATDTWLDTGAKDWTSVIEKKQVPKKTEAVATQTGAGETETVDIKLFHDDVLGAYYQNKYPLRTVVQLGGTVDSTDFVNKHYGDWPAPEIFVPNTPSS